MRKIFSKSELSLYLLFILSFALIGFVSRLTFMFLAHSATLEEDLFKALWLGFRFDLSIAGYVLCLLLLWQILYVFIVSKVKFFTNRAYLSLTLGLFSFVFFINLFIHVVDLGYFLYFKDRLSLMLFGLLEDDTWALIKTIWKDYPVLWMILGLFLTTAIFTKILSINLKNYLAELQAKEVKASGFLTSIKFVSFFLVFALLSRGSLGLFPLGDLDTAISKNEFYNLLGFNSVHAFAKAVRLKGEQKSKWNSNLSYYGYDADPQQAIREFSEFLPSGQNLALGEEENSLNHFTNQILLQKTSPFLTHSELSKKQPPPHLVLIVMESFGTYGLRQQSENFNLLGALKTHFQEDYYTLNFLSATGATIGSLSSLINGVPHRAHSEFVTESENQYTSLMTSPASTLKSNGYQSRFIYGGNPGWRDINKYAKLQGFDFIDGDVEIAKAIAITESHDWGLYDQDLFRYVEKILAEASSPQFLLVMTTTNHPPYELPKSYPRPKDLTPPQSLSEQWSNSSLALKRIQTLRYANDSLGEFLNRLKDSAQLKNQVRLAVTGDHTFWLAPVKASEYLLNNSVPLYLYNPYGFYPEKEIFGSHQDILPTLYDLSGLNFSYYSFGQSLYHPSTSHYALNHSNLIFSKTGAVMLLNANEFSTFCWKPNNETYLFNEIESCEKTAEHTTMFKYYKSLMGSLDLFFKYNQKSH